MLYQYIYKFDDGIFLVNLLEIFENLEAGEGKSRKLVRWEGGKKQNKLGNFGKRERLCKLDSKFAHWPRKKEGLSKYHYGKLY